MWRFCTATSSQSGCKDANATCLRFSGIIFSHVTIKDGVNCLNLANTKIVDVNYTSLSRCDKSGLNVKNISAREFIVNNLFIDRIFSGNGIVIEQSETEIQLTDVTITRTKTNAMLFKGNNAQLELNRVNITDNEAYGIAFDATSYNISFRASASMFQRNKNNFYDNYDIFFSPQELPKIHILVLKLINVEFVYRQSQQTLFFLYSKLLADPVTICRSIYMIQH